VLSAKKTVAINVNVYAVLLSKHADAVRRLCSRFKTLHKDIVHIHFHLARSRRLPILHNAILPAISDSDCSYAFFFLFVLHKFITNEYQYQ